MKRKTPLFQQLSDNNIKYYSPLRTFCVIMICVVFLMVTGYSIAVPAHQAELQIYYEDSTLIMKTVIYGVISIVCGLIVLFVRVKNHNKLTKVFAALGLLLMIWVVRDGYMILGAQRWIQFAGLLFQPVHFLLIAQIFILAYFIEEKQKSDCYMKWTIYMWIVSVILAVFAYCALQDLHHVLVILGIGFLFSMMFCGHIFEHIVVLVASAIPFIFMTIRSVFWDVSNSGYWQMRIDAWIHPAKYPFSFAYEALTSLNAIQSAGWYGKESNPTELVEILQDAYNNDIFSLICYERGWLFAGLIILVYMILSIEIFRVFHMELNRKHYYSAVVALGVFTYITYEYSLCTLSSLNLIPIAARFLPFISDNGAWIIALTIMVAAILRITMQQMKENRKKKLIE